MTRETLQIRAIKGNHDTASTYLNSERKLCGDHTIKSMHKNNEMLYFWALQAERNMQNKYTFALLLLAAFEDPECDNK